MDVNSEQVCVIEKRVILRKKSCLVFSFNKKI